MQCSTRLRCPRSLLQQAVASAPAGRTHTPVTAPDASQVTPRHAAAVPLPHGGVPAAQSAPGAAWHCALASAASQLPGPAASTASFRLSSSWAAGRPPQRSSTRRTALHPPKRPLHLPSQGTAAAALPPLAGAPCGLPVPPGPTSLPAVHKRQEPPRDPPPSHHPLCSPLPPASLLPAPATLPAPRSVAWRASCSHSDQRWHPVCGGSPGRTGCQEAQTEACRWGADDRSKNENCRSWKLAPPPRVSLPDC